MTLLFYDIIIKNRTFVVCKNAKFLYIADDGITHGV